MTAPIKVWWFHDAPQELQDLSQHGGDEDWLALIPAEHYRKHGQPEWAEEGYGSRFGRCSTQWTELQNGDVVAIGAHA